MGKRAAANSELERNELKQASTINKVICYYHMKGVKKEHLPEKICKACGRPFSWRKKWERCWDEVQYCSEGCKKQKPKK
jgi:hypothetical protein